MTHESYTIRDYKNDKSIKSIKEKLVDPIPEEYKNTVIPLQTESYEKLEFLGDSVIHLTLAEYLFKRYSEKDEGFFTKLRTKIENGQTLTHLAKTLGLYEYVLISRNIEQNGGRDNDSLFEDTLEAFIGALFIDSKEDYNLCKKLVINIIESHLDFAHIIYNENNYKDMLLQYHHKMKWNDPEYECIETIEKNSKKYFNMCVKGPNGVAGTGIGTSKKKGEQIAANKALTKYGVINDDDSDEEISYY